jgi:hypothetical protein
LRKSFFRFGLITRIEGHGAPSEKFADSPSRKRKSGELPPPFKITLFAKFRARNARTTVLGTDGNEPDYFED